MKEYRPNQPDVTSQYQYIRQVLQLPRPAKKPRLILNQRRMEIGSGMYLAIDLDKVHVTDSAQLPHGEH